MIKTKPQILQEGQSARRLLEDTDLTLFLDEIDQVSWGEFKTTASNDIVGREAIYARLKGVELVRQHLKIAVDNATLEKKSSKE